MFALKEFNLDHPLVLFILNSSPAVHIARNFKEEHQRAFFVKIANIHPQDLEVIIFQSISLISLH